jgi:hypothetical protein
VASALLALPKLLVLLRLASVQQSARLVAVVLLAAYVLLP